jgi:hypothetical protein
MGVCSASRPCHLTFAETAFKRGNHATVNNYRPISILNNFSKLFEFIAHDHILHYTKFNPNQHSNMAPGIHQIGGPSTMTEKNILRMLRTET